MEQASRTQAWEQLVTKETNILVATGTYFIVKVYFLIYFLVDLAARGLDSTHADLVINIEMSSSSEVMTHRIGRAGRYGARGESIFLISTEEVESFKKMKTQMKLEINQFENFDELLDECSRKLKFSSDLKAKEGEQNNEPDSEIDISNTLPNDDDRSPEPERSYTAHDQSGKRIARTISAEKEPIHVFPKPVIPPLWEVLGIPGPIKEPNSMQLAQSKVIEAEYAKIQMQENQTSREKRNITEHVKIPPDLDQWTDDQFRIGCLCLPSFFFIYIQK